MKEELTLDKLLEAKRLAEESYPPEHQAMVMWSLTEKKK